MHPEEGLVEINYSPTGFLYGILLKIPVTVELWQSRLPARNDGNDAIYSALEC